MKMNRRYTYIDQLTIKPSTGADIVVNCNIRPDSRDQLRAVVEFAGVGADAAVVSKVSVTGHVNYDTGELTVQGVIIADPAATLTYTFKAASVKARFVPVNTMRGRTVVKISNEIKYQ